jgi:hypothetical protein
MPNVRKEHGSIFMIEEKVKQETIIKQAVGKHVSFVGTKYSQLNFNTLQDVISWILYNQRREKPTT